MLGYIKDQIPAQRDGAIMVLMLGKTAATAKGTATPKESTPALRNLDPRSRKSFEQETPTHGPPLEKVLVLMGGDRLQRAFNDTFVMPL